MTQTKQAVDINALQAEIESLKAKLAAKNKLSYKVSEKTGALSVYGLQRFPVTLFKQQWERLFAAREEIANFIAANEASLKVKE